MTARLMTLSLALALITACGTQSSDYSFTSIQLDGAEGAQLDEDNERIYTGMEQVICDATIEMEVVDVDVDADSPEVLDVKDDLVLYVDGGMLEVFHAPTGNTGEVDVEDGGEGSDPTDAQFFEDGIAILEGCSVKFSEGPPATLPGENCTGDLIEGDGLMVRIDGDGVYEVVPGRATRVSGAHSLAWDGPNEQWLMGQDERIRGWSKGDVVWSFTHDRDLVDVFPLSGMVGFRDVEGDVYELDADGGGNPHRMLWFGVDGHIVGSLGPKNLAVFDRGLIVMSFD